MSTLEPGTSTSLPDAITDLMLSWPAAEAMPRVDLYALLLGADGRVCAPRDAVVSRAEPTAASGAVWFLGADASTATIRITPSALPARVARIVVVASIGDLPLARFPGLTVYAYSASKPFATWPVSGHTETALVLAEVGRGPDGWRLTAVGQGLAGGLPDVPIRHEVIHAFAPVAIAGPVPGSLSRPTDRALDARIALRKQQVADYLRARGLAGIRGRVVMVLDVSGSMTSLYGSGVVARMVERLASVAAILDPGEVMEVWAFAERRLLLPPLYVPRIAEWLPHVDTSAVTARLNLGTATDAVAAVRTILDRHVPPPGGGPTLVVFLSDGAIDVQGVKALVKDAESRPAFWQFVEVGPHLCWGEPDPEHQERVIAESNFLIRPILRRELRRSRQGVPNVGHFGEEDIDALTDEQLHDRLLGEFSTWLTAARARGIAGR
ncbi:VWA domain-containing protein [Embleya sp. NPDC050493]|uniref:VWA domain-containing protein n=1 Tax=Embleya sp. NPDC050493 TaxID=3363989 RepID=UPI003797CFFF